MLDIHRSMHADFGRIFARERVGGFEKRHQHLIEQVAVVHDMAVICLMRNHFLIIEWLAILQMFGIESDSLIAVRGTFHIEAEVIQEFGIGPIANLFMYLHDHIKPLAL